MKLSLNLFRVRSYGALLVLPTVLVSECAALTWEGKSLTLTLPDYVTVYTSDWEARERSDSYGCSWKTPERLNDFEFNVFGRAGETKKEELKAFTEEHLANIKAEIAEYKFKKTCTNVQPVQFRTGGLAGYGFQVIRDDSPKSKSMDAFMLLWGGDRAWQVSFSGTQNQYNTMIRFLESVVWKPKAMVEGRPGLSEMTLPPQEQRTWTNVAGKTFEGKLVSINDVGSILRIERSDGQVFEGIPVNFLSAKDREYIKTTIQVMEKNTKANPKGSK